ncbi:MAG TPA: Ppx/GppA phosphatase family protein [Bacteroidia bacterium]|nr:Ppx/GppA phosphatase family protein [Bacteroidia bacterium]
MKILTAQVKSLLMSQQPTRNSRIAVLDLGTNTFHLLIVDVYPEGKCRKVFKSKIVVKLGEGGIHKSFITEKSFSRGIRALKHYAEIIKKNQAREVYAFATSAIRSAKNGPDFARVVLQQTGIRIKIISGEEEARLICLGVRQCIEMNDEAVLIMDIGGGSTEFIIADKENIFARHSFNIGAARLLELFNPSDPVNEDEVLKVEKFLKDQLSDLDKSIKKFPVNKLIGSSGSFDTFAEMIGYKFHNKNVLKNVNSYDFELSEYCELHDELLLSTKAQRNKMKGLIKMRVDMIVLASICTSFVLKRYSLNEMALSKFALKEGALWEIINKVVKSNSANGIKTGREPHFVKTD